MFRCILKYTKNPTSNYLVVNYKSDGYSVHFLNKENLIALTSDESCDCNYVIKDGDIKCYSMDITSGSIGNNSTTMVDDSGTISDVLYKLIGCEMIIGNKSYILDNVNVSKSTTSVYTTIYDNDEDKFKFIKLYDYDKAEFVNPVSFNSNTVPDSVKKYGFTSGDKWSVDLNSLPLTNHTLKLTNNLWYSNSFADIVFWVEIPNIMLNGINFMLRMCDYNFDNYSTHDGGYKSRDYGIKRTLKINHCKNTPYKPFQVDNLEVYQKEPSFPIKYPYDLLFYLGMQAITIDNDLGYNINEVVMIKDYLKKEYSKRQMLLLKAKYIGTDVLIPMLKMNPDYNYLTSLVLSGSFCEVILETE